MNELPELEDAVLGLDLGSTSTRATVRCPKRNLEFDVRNKNSRIKWSYKYTKGEFSSSGYPFEPGKAVYLGEKGDPDRHEISLKYAFYILVDEADHGKDRIFEQYALVNPLRQCRNDVGFRQRLRRGLVELFSAVRDMAREQCRSQGLRITSIGLSVPSQWTIEFEDVYRDIIAEVFDELTRPNEQIWFHTETEALAHYLLRNHLRQLLGEQTFLELERNRSAHKPLLFLDFGGHNMNGCMFNVVCAGEDTASFYSMSEPFGAGGGSEHWAYYMCELFVRNLRRIHGQRLKQSAIAKYLDCFHSNKDDLGPLEPDETQDLPGDLRSIQLLPEDINRSFEMGTKRVFEEAEIQIKSLALIKNASPQVIVSGGTSMHRAVVKELNGICARHGVQQPTYVWDSEGPMSNYASGNIAKGVAYATCNHLTIHEFIQQGAGFGLQRKQVPTRGEPESAGGWEDDAPPIFSLTSPEPLEIRATGNDKFRIICDPHFDMKGVKKQERMQFDRCYDIKDLGKLMNGIWWFEMFLTTSHNQPAIALRIRREKYSGQRYPGGGQSRKGPKDLNAPGGDKKKEIILPLYFDGGKNCFLLEESFDVSSLNLGSNLKPARNSRKDLQRLAVDKDFMGTRRSARQAEKVEHTATPQSSSASDQITSTKIDDIPNPTFADLSVTDAGRSLPTSSSRFAPLEGPVAPEAVMAPAAAPTSIPTPPLAQGDFTCKQLHVQNTIPYRHGTPKHCRAVSDDASESSRRVYNSTSKDAHPKRFKPTFEPARRKVVTIDDSSSMESDTEDDCSP